MIDRKMKGLVITMAQIKRALFNWEDIHEDEELNFYSSCGTLWTGKRGKEIINNPFITIAPKDEKHFIMIHEDDSSLVDFAISIILGRQNDIYEDYEFSGAQWEDILNEMDKLVGFETFDELFDYILSIKENSEGRCDLIYYFNHCGAIFWKKKWLHEL